MPGGQASARTPRPRRETRAGARTAEAESGRERAAQGRAREPTSPQNAEPARRLGFEGDAHDGDSAADVDRAGGTAAPRSSGRLANVRSAKKRKQERRKKRMGEARGSRNTGGATGTGADADERCSGRTADRHAGIRKGGTPAPARDSDARNDDNRVEGTPPDREVRTLEHHDSEDRRRRGQSDGQRQVGNSNGQAAMSEARRARGIKDNLIPIQAEVDARQDEPPWDGPNTNAVAGDSSPARSATGEAFRQEHRVGSITPKKEAELRERFAHEFERCPRTAVVTYHLLSGLVYQYEADHAPPDEAADEAESDEAESPAGGGGAESRQAVQAGHDAAAAAAPRGEVVPAAAAGARDGAVPAAAPSAALPR